MSSAALDTPSSADERLDRTRDLILGIGEDFALNMRSGRLDVKNNPDHRALAVGYRDNVELPFTAYYTRIRREGISLVGANSASDVIAECNRYEDLARSYQAKLKAVPGVKATTPDVPVNVPPVTPSQAISDAARAVMAIAIVGGIIYIGTQLRRQ